MHMSFELSFFLFFFEGAWIDEGEISIIRSNKHKRRYHQGCSIINPLKVSE